MSLLLLELIQKISVRVSSKPHHLWSKQKVLEKPLEGSQLKDALKFMASEGWNLIMTFIIIKINKEAGAATEVEALGRGHANNFNIYMDVRSRGWLPQGSD